MFFIAKKRGATKKDGFLSEEELHYWNQHLKVDEEHIPTLPTSTFVSLTNNQPVRQQSFTNISIIASLRRDIGQHMPINGQI